MKDNQVGFLLSIQGLRSRLGMRAMTHCVLQPVRHEAFTDTDHRVTAYLKGFGHLLVKEAADQRRGS